MMLAALPPSSRVSFLPVPATVTLDLFAHLGRSRERDLVDVIDGERVPDRSGPAPVMMFTTPSGRSACSQISAKSSAVSGVVSAGFSTTVFPAARAGAIFHESISSGKFHGMICAHTPSGLARAARERVRELVGPARVVEEMGGNEWDVDIAAFLDGFSAIHRLEHGQFAARSCTIRAIRKMYLARSTSGQR